MKADAVTDSDLAFYKLAWNVKGRVDQLDRTERRLLALLEELREHVYPAFDLLLESVDLLLEHVDAVDERLRLPVDVLHEAGEDDPGRSDVLREVPGVAARLETVQARERVVRNVAHARSLIRDARQVKADEA